MRLNSKTAFYEAVVTFFYTGYLPFGPGTWASLFALLLGYGILGLWGIWGLLWSFVLVLFVGTYACYQQLKPRPYLKDPRDYVVDEVVGQWLMMLGLAAFVTEAWWMQVAGFFAFRFFDIYKPWPISWVNELDRFESPALRSFSIMFDDLLAGAVGGAVLWGLYSVSH